jgi:hypothetical protein
MVSDGFWSAVEVLFLGVCHTISLHGCDLPLRCNRCLTTCPERLPHRCRQRVAQCQTIETLHHSLRLKHEAASSSMTTTKFQRSISYFHIWSLSLLPKYHLTSNKLRTSSNHHGLGSSKTPNRSLCSPLCSTHQRLSCWFPSLPHRSVTCCKLVASSMLDKAGTTIMLSWIP